MTHEFLGDVLRLHVAEELVAVLLVKFHEHVGSLVAVEQPVEIFGLFQVKSVVQLGNVGRVQLLEERLGSGVVAVGNYLP